MIRKSQLTYYFITVNYNCSAYTIKYLDSIDRLHKENNDVKVVIVDNGSTPDDIKRLDDYISGRGDFVLVKNNGNIGYFGGLNIGLSTIHDHEYMCIIGNNDIEFDPGFLVCINNMQYDNDVLVLAPNVITRDGFHQNPVCIKRVSQIRKACYKIYFSNYYLGEIIYLLYQQIKKMFRIPRSNAWKHRQIIHLGIGACYILTENFFRFYKKLDERVFLFGEESLLAGQVNAVGGKTLYDPNIIVHHNESMSVGKISTRETFRIRKQSYRIYSRYL